MIGGFAVVAWPVKYGDTGVMTFIVSHDGVVYEKDLGPDTAARAARDDALRSGLELAEGRAADLIRPRTMETTLVDREGAFVPPDSCTSL